MESRIWKMYEASTCHQLIGIIILFLQTWHQSMPDNESFAWDHVVVWSSDAISQSFHLHFYDPQLYSGELFVPQVNSLNSSFALALLKAILMA